MRLADGPAQGMRLSALGGKRVAVWGYGREGRAALAALRARFPDQLITLFCGEEEAQDFSLLPPGEGKLNIVTAPPDSAALSAFDIVIKSPGISPYREPYPAAEKSGVRFTSGTAIWFAEHAKAKTICVTGTKGKSTVTALIAHLLRAGGKRVALAGNIGLPLLELFDVETAPDWWVIELSSFQTRDFGGAPTVAVINNLYEEHLDWHGTRANYAADKLRIAQRASRVVVNAALPEAVWPQGQGVLLAFNQVEGWHVRGDAIWRGDERVL